METLRIALCFVALAGALSGCRQKSFECGTPASNDPDVITRCDRALEICVCATRSCAKRQAPPPDVEPGRDAGTTEQASGQCPSGYRYVDAPFADSEWAGECVPMGHLQSESDFLESDERGQACDPGEIRDAGMMEEPRDGGMDASADATTDAGPPDAGEDASTDAAQDAADSDGMTDDEDGGEPEGAP